MPNAVYCNWDTCKHNSDGSCKKTVIVLETVEKGGNKVLICRQYEAVKPVNIQVQQICPECGYRLIQEGGCSYCMNCGFSPCK